MHKVISAGLLFSVLLLQGATPFAQGVYVTPGAKGPVFSDKPQVGAKEVTLRPLNVVAPTESKGATPPAATVRNDNMKAEVVVPSYRSFTVVSPEDNGSVVANTALFEVRVSVEPPLQLGERHAFVVSINGRPVGQRFTATEFMIPPEFWGDTLPPANQSLQVDASIVDGNGQVLKKAAPVRFFMRYATILNNPRRPVPLPATPPRQPVPKPLPRPTLDLPAGAAIRNR